MLASDGPHHERLHQASLADRHRELFDLSFGEIPPGIEAAGFERIQRHEALAFHLAEFGALALADERGKASPEPHLVHADSHDGLLVSAAALETQLPPLALDDLGSEPDIGLAA